MRIADPGRLAFTALMIVVGVMGLVKGDFAPVWDPVPKTIPAREVLVYASALVSLLSGLGLLLPRTKAVAARLLVASLLFWLLRFRLPALCRMPGAVVSWEGSAETVVIFAGAWALYAQGAAEWDRRYLGFASGDAGVRIARLLYALSLIPFGLAHLAYVKETAALVPAWLPSPVSWVYLTGGTYIAAGAALATGICARLAAALSALQIGLFTLLVWVPMVMAAGPKAPFQWSETVISFALTAAAWVIADSYRGLPWGAVRRVPG